MAHDYIGTAEGVDEALAGGSWIVDPCLAHPIAPEANLVYEWVPHQPLMFGVGVHDRRRKVEAVCREREPLAAEQVVVAPRRKERDIVAAVGEAVGGLDERRHVTEVGVGCEDHCCDAVTVPTLRPYDGRVFVTASPDQARAILGGMREVATAGGTTALTDADRAALIAAGRYVLRLPDPVDVDALPDVDPGALAKELDDRALADHAGQFLAAMALIDGALDRAKIDVVLRYAAALGIHEDYVRQLADAAHSHLKWVLGDMARQNLKSIVGYLPDVSLDRWIMPYRDGHEDVELAARYRALGDLREESFGRAFFEFYQANGFAFPGEAAAVNQQFATPHDSSHVMSGYSTSLQGELLVSTFTGGMHPDNPMSGHILPVIFSWHLGIEIVKFAGSAKGSLDPEKFWVAWERGGETTQDLFAHDWDYWTVVHEPLDDLRRRYGVSPLDPAHAADDTYPDWYHPSA